MKARARDRFLRDAEEMLCQADDLPDDAQHGYVRTVVRHTIWVLAAAIGLHQALMDHVDEALCETARERESRLA